MNEGIHLDLDTWIIIIIIIDLDTWIVPVINLLV